MCVLILSRADESPRSTPINYAAENPWNHESSWWLSQQGDFPTKAEESGPCSQERFGCLSCSSWYSTLLHLHLQSTGSSKSFRYFMIFQAGPKQNYLIKGSLEEILPSYEKLRSVCAHVRDAKRSSLTVGRVGTLGAARLRRGCGAVAARFRRRPPSRLRHSFSLIFWCAYFYWEMQLQSARRIGRRVQRLRQGKHCAVYYWGMQLQSARRIGRRV